MIITGINLDILTSLTAEVSAARYDGNVIVHREAKRLSPIRSRARLTVQSSRAPGARRSRKGRRLVAACWHAHRDVMTAIFAIAPQVRIYTGMASYRGVSGFLANYPGTAHVNIGSRYEPAYMPNLCDCYGDTRSMPYRILRADDVDSPAMPRARARTVTPTSAPRVDDSDGIPWVNSSNPDTSQDYPFGPTVRRSDILSRIDDAIREAEK